MWRSSQGGSSSSLVAKWGPKLGKSLLDAFEDKSFKVFLTFLGQLKEAASYDLVLLFWHPQLEEALKLLFALILEFALFQALNSGALLLALLLERAFILGAHDLLIELLDAFLLEFSKFFHGNSTPAAFNKDSFRRDGIDRDLTFLDAGILGVDLGRCFLFAFLDVRALKTQLVNLFLALV